MVFICWARRLLSCWFSSKSDIGENSNAYLICAVCVEERNGLNPAALYDVTNVRFAPPLLALHDPLAEHAATDQMVAQRLLYRISATQLISAIKKDGLASAFTFGFFTCQFTLTANGFFFLARFPN